MANSLKLVREATGQYIVVDYNDEKLRIIAEALLKSDIREKIKEILNNLESISDKYQLLSPKDATIKYHILKESNDFILLRVTNESATPDETNPKQIDMNCEEFLDIIDQWEDLEIEEPPYIFMKNDEDKITLTGNPTDI